jgi:hypothetical protein
MRWPVLRIPMGECLNPTCADSRMLSRALCTNHETDLDTMLDLFTEKPDVMRIK